MKSEVLQKAWPAAWHSVPSCSTMPASSRAFFMSSTAGLVPSSTASRRRSTNMGRMTSRYLPRLKMSRSTSSAMPQM